MRCIVRGLPVIIGLTLLLQHQPAGASVYPLAHILPKAEAEKLEQAGIKTSEELLEKGGSPAGRNKLAKATGIAAKQLLDWVRMADLLRIKGVGPVMVKLLGAAKVTSVAQLKQATAKKLYDKMMAANEKDKITQNPPSEKHLENWIEQAKQLKVVVK